MTTGKESLFQARVLTYLREQAHARNIAEIAAALEASEDDVRAAILPLTTGHDLARPVDAGHGTDGKLAFFINRNYRERHDAP